MGRAWPIELGRGRGRGSGNGGRGLGWRPGELQVHGKEGGMQAEVGTNAESFNEFE